ncbi:MAPEG family protein [Cognatishimia sp.]|uniref:MAPEG family protein n=1 Tax=Cognatishimia sp. TaxID=2211648 RepID=UPI003511E5B0
MSLQSFLQPVVGLILWTLVVWLWMYATRIPAMSKAHVHPQTAQSPRGAWREKLPEHVNWVADNYNHLHEQPTVFYALMLTLALLESQSATALTLAWIYVALRILHSLSQILGNRVVVRFGIFALSGLVLVALAAHAAVAAFTA